MRARDCRSVLPFSEAAVYVVSVDRCPAKVQQKPKEWPYQAIGEPEILDVQSGKANEQPKEDELENPSSKARYTRGTRSCDKGLR